MKKTIHLALLPVCAALLLSSCSHHFNLTRNENVHNTTVELSQKNYRVVSYVTGNASATYFFGMGGFGQLSLLENARSNMLRGADLLGKSRAVINETVSVRASTVPIVRTVTVTVGAYIIEFQ